MKVDLQYGAADGDLRLLILTWYRRARLAQLAHARAASRARRGSILLGVPTVALGAIVGSAIFASINETPGNEWKILAGLLSLASAVLAALQTFLRLDERSREHEAASRAFGTIRRELGELGAIAQQSRESVKARLDHIRQAYDRIAEASRNAPNGIWADLSAHSGSFWPPEFAAWPEASANTSSGNVGPEPE
jgi:Protein of unknown function (DUF4231)